MINDYYRQIDIDRFNYIIARIPDGVSTILDIGAWDNQFKELLQGYEVTTLDSEPHAKGMIKATITNLPFKDNSFDLVTALETLEHLGNIELLEAREEISRVSREWIIVSVPYNEMPLGEGHKQSFSKARFECFFSHVHTFYFGWRASYKGIRRQLCYIDKRLAFLIDKVFGIKTITVSNWIIGVFKK